MKAIVKITDNVSLEVEAEKEMETLHKAIVLGNPKTVCNECGNKEDFYFASNKDSEGNIYVNYKCTCGARSKLGQYKAGGYFWKDFEKYVPPAQTLD